MDLSRALVGPVLIATSLLAQDAGPVLPRFCVPIHTAADDLGQPYGIWAAGADYKVSFHGDMTFVPYLGGGYPVNRPWSWHTTSVRVGGRELLAENPEPRRREFERRYEYDFGAVTETYDVRLEGLEQTFVFAERLGEGEIVIEGRLTSDLIAGPATPAHRSLTFHDPAGTPILTYGEAAVIDATGDRMAITTELVDDRITLRVPARWLDGAAFPVVVDPLLATHTLFASSPNSYVPNRVAIAHNAEVATSNTMFVFDRRASALDYDLFAYLTGADLAPTSPSFLVYSDINTTWNSLRGGCACVGGADQWVIVFQRHFVNSTPTRSALRAHRHASGSTAHSTAVSLMTPPSPLNDAAPAIGGVAAWDNGTEALIVFEREDNAATAGNYATTNRTEVHGVLFDASTGAFGSSFHLGGGGSTDCQDPCVTAFRTDGGEWVTAFSILLPSTGVGDWEVRGRKVDAGGTPSTALWSSPGRNNDSVHEFSPAIDGRDGRYLIAFTTADVTATNHAPDTGDQGWAQRVDWPTGAATAATSLAPVQLDTEVLGLLQTSAVTYDWADRSMFVVTWHHGFTLTAGIYAARIGYDGLVTEGPLTVLPSLTAFPGACAFDGSNRNVLLAWTSSFRVEGCIFGYPAVAPAGTSGTACSPTVLRWVGAQQIGTEFGKVNAIKAGAPNALHFLMASLTTTNQPIPGPGVMPGCNLLVDNVNGFLGTLGLRIGSSVTWDFPLPSWLDPVTFHFQDWILDGPLFEGSVRLSVPVAK
ncbi:MAG: hypothetical protein KDE27_09140 [Planctomycetes bacterium]|nr:hypothetical protein [Planctomycetota bacterium]